MKQRPKRYIGLAFNLTAGCANLVVGLLAWGSMVSWWPQFALVIAGVCFGTAISDIMWMRWGAKVVPLTDAVMAEMERENHRIAQNLVDQIEAEIDRRGLRGAVEDIKAVQRPVTRH